MDKRLLSERDICSKFILPALIDAGWDLHSQIAEERTLTAGRIIVRGKLVARGQKKRADFVLYLKPNIPIAVIEAKDNRHSVGDGIQQALKYSEMLQVAKVDALMALCDRLEAALTTTDTTRTRLLEALLHETLKPASEVLEAAE